MSGGGFGGGASAFSFSSRSSSPNDDETIRAQNALVKSNTRTHVSFSDKTWVMSFRNCAVGGWSPRKRGRIMCMFINARQMKSGVSRTNKHNSFPVQPPQSESQRRAQQTIPRYPKSTLYNIYIRADGSFIRLKHIYVTLVFLSFHTARTTPLFRDAISFSFNTRILIFYSSNSSSSSSGASNPPPSETETSSPLSKA